MIHRRQFLATTTALSTTLLLPGDIRAQESDCCENKRFTLKDGRRLSYATYGRPGGWPVLYFHGIPTSRIEARFFAPAAFRAGCQLIAIDRPGFGSSDFKCGRTIVDWLDDVNEFVNSPHLPNHMDLSRFSIACFSSGAAYALLCGAGMPSRVHSIGVVDGIAPLELIHGDGGYAQVGFRLANNNPRMVRAAFDFNTRQMYRRPDRVLRRTSLVFSKCDGSVFFEPDNAQILIDSYLQCVNQGADGVVHDMALLGRPWGFRLNDVHLPVALWYGACDITTPVASMGNCLNRLIPNSTLSIYSNQGHLSMLNQAGDELFRHLLQGAG